MDTRLPLVHLTEATNQAGGLTNRYHNMISVNQQQLCRAYVALVPPGADIGEKISIFYYDTIHEWLAEMRLINGSEYKALHIRDTFSDSRSGTK